MSKWGDMTELDEPERLRKRVEALEAALEQAAAWCTEQHASYAEMSLAQGTVAARNYYADRSGAFRQAAAAVREIARAALEARHD